MSKKCFISCFFIFWIGIAPIFSQTTDIVYLNASEIERLREVISRDEQAKHHHDSISGLVLSQFKDQPRSLEKIYYEGLLQNNPDRIDTRKSLEDVDKVVNLLYAYYGNGRMDFAEKAKEYISAWASTYVPNGNPINENKFVPMFWAYHLFRDHFSEEEKKDVEDWMIRIAHAEKSRNSTPNNNWEAKRLKIIGAVGCILSDLELKEYAVSGFKEYINSALSGWYQQRPDRAGCHALSCKRTQTHHRSFCEWSPI